MAKIKKVIEEGSIQYPATITDAVKNPNNGKTVTEELSELGSEVDKIAMQKHIDKSNRGTQFDLFIYKIVGSCFTVEASIELNFVVYLLKDADNSTAREIRQSNDGKVFVEYTEEDAVNQRNVLRFYAVGEGENFDVRVFGQYAKNSSFNIIHGKNNVKDVLDSFDKNLNVLGKNCSILTLTKKITIGGEDFNISKNLGLQYVISVDKDVKYVVYLLKDADNSTAREIRPLGTGETIVSYTKNDLIIGRNVLRFYALEEVEEATITVTLQSNGIRARLFTPKTMSVIGDSYSAFGGFIPTEYQSWYPNEGNDVTQVEDMWWYQFAKDVGCRIGNRNNSFSGTTICKTTRTGLEVQSFVDRINLLSDADLVIIEGGTNDSWIDVPIGSLKYSDWTEEDLKNFRPALAYVLDYATKHLNGADIIFMLNDGLKYEINISVETICQHYGVKLFKLSSITKEGGHPNKIGHTEIKTQLIEFLNIL